jgi:hypothetical protein
MASCARSRTAPGSGHQRRAMLLAKLEGNPKIETRAQHQLCQDAGAI